MPDDTPDALLRCSSPRTPLNLSSPPRHAQKNTGALSPAPPAHSAATSSLAPGCTRKNSASRAASCAQYNRSVQTSCHTDSEAPSPGGCAYVAITDSIHTPFLRHFLPCLGLGNLRHSEIHRARKFCATEKGQGASNPMTE